MVIRFELPSLNFYVTIRQARDNSTSANSLVTLLSSEEMFSSIAQRLLEIIHFCTEKGTVHCLPVDWPFQHTASHLKTFIASTLHCHHFRLLTLPNLHYS